MVVNVIIFQVKNLSVARDMVKSLAVEAQASREANGLLIMQKGEGRSLEKIKLVKKGVPGEFI